MESGIHVLLHKGMYVGFLYMGIPPHGRGPCRSPQTSHWAVPSGTADTFMMINEGFQFPDLSRIHLLSTGPSKEASPAPVLGKNPIMVSYTLWLTFLHNFWRSVQSVSVMSQKSASNHIDRFFLHWSPWDGVLRSTWWQCRVARDLHRTMGLK